MRKFDTKVQYIKYRVLKEVASLAWQDKLLENILNIPSTIVPGKIPTMRCCVYKERAILAQRVKIAMGGDKNNSNTIEIIDIACDECPDAGYVVTETCRGCLAHRCEDVCKVGAITFDANHVAHIDKSKCVECGMCAKVCPYFAIINRVRPCQAACKVKAIYFNEENAAKIDENKCIQCGACVYQCPFGAIDDKSFILDVIEFIKNKKEDSKVIAMIAPSIASQFSNVKLTQVVTGLNRLGFDMVIETALGADMVAESESKELIEKGFLLSSCCPGFVSYVKINFPELEHHLSHNLSPMAHLGKKLKEKNPKDKIVFIGPCTAKKQEALKEKIKDYIDSVITFEELQALFDSKNIDITNLEETKLNDGSYYGRVFARSGGLTEAIAQGIKEHNSDFEFKPVICDGIDACKIALLKKKNNILDGNFIEGMVCEGGCIGGAGCLTHTVRNKVAIDKYGKDSLYKTITESLNK
ncbi:MAG TPA: 4Fe-4S dicluster domain-containing protein [Erysipelotrichaceae bacterium]|nr:4Fe-4S dicluster domain-containing protein [Erysipelotrichaceae bacterium]HQA85809.1 4Fe-4S dicluster domain-containing protein [Erysipelotrichaceae bacterium]